MLPFDVMQTMGTGLSLLLLLLLLLIVKGKRTKTSSGLRVAKKKNENKMFRVGLRPDGYPIHQAKNYYDAVVSLIVGLTVA